MQFYDAGDQVVITAVQKFRGLLDNLRLVFLKNACGLGISFPSLTIKRRMQ